MCLSSVFNKILGLSDGKPVAAWIIYKSFLHWKSFEDKRTNVFDRVIEMLGSVTLALKATGAAEVTPRQRRTSTLFERVAQGFRSSTLTSSSYSNGVMVGGLDLMRQVEAKYPALLFKQQITVTVQKIYGIIRENVKAEIKAYLDLCIQASRTAKANMFRTPRSQPNASAQQANVNHWQKIIKCLSDLLESMQKNNVPTVLIKKIIYETFSFINMQLFNSLLLRRDCCSFSNGEYVKAGLAELEQWCDDANEFAGSAWDELKHIRQTVGFLLAGFNLEVVETKSAGHASSLAKNVDISKCHDGIICVGGDGIVNEVLNGLISREDPKEAMTIPIGIIPAGSDNSLVWTVLGQSDPVSAAVSIVKIMVAISAEGLRPLILQQICTSAV